MKIFITNSSSETQKLGRELAKRILLEQGVSLPKKSACVIALYGDLGSGKTTFVQGLAKGFGIKRRIISPTFIIVKSYKINLKSQISNLKTTTQISKLFYHIDLYRTSSSNGVEGLGLEEIINDPRNIVAIEWAEKMGDLLPKKRFDIKFEYLDENKRRITVRNIKSQIAKLKTTN